MYLSVLLVLPHRNSLSSASQEPRRRRSVIPIAVWKQRHNSVKGSGGNLSFDRSWERQIYQSMVGDNLAFRFDHPNAAKESKGEGEALFPNVPLIKR